MDIRIMQSPLIDGVALGAISSLLADSDNTSPSKPENDNRKVKSDWMTPSEALQAIQRLKRKIRAENAQTQILMNSPQRRRIWDEVVACEQCLLWKYFRNS